MPDCLYIVVPCYNEHDVLPVSSELFRTEISLLISRGKISDESRILFVDDGSTDDTWSIISAQAESDGHFLGIRLSRNRGHQNALLAGLMEAKECADMAISIDCDGQDDISAMEEMIDAYYDGCEIVYGVRSRRDTDTFFKRSTAQAFYRLLNKMGAEVVYNHADYRLVSSRVLNEFSNFRETNLFLRGMFPLVGFKSACVQYERRERLAGKSHYPLAKMISLACDGITSLSIKPIRIITMIGIWVSCLSFAGTIWAVVHRLSGRTIEGWASTVCIVCFIGGVQLVCLGVLGEYIGKMYLEVKSRPRYIVSGRTRKEAETSVREK